MLAVWQAATQPTAVLTNGQYLLWGDNGLVKQPTVATTAFSGLSHHFAAIWKVQNTGNVGTVRVAWPKNLTNLTLIQSSDATIDGSDVATPMSGEISINGVVYNYADVVLANGTYFTFGAKLAGPGGVVAGLMMWHRADDGTADSGPKNIWRDASGLGRDVTQNVKSDYRPTLITNSTHVADKKTYQFNFNPFYYFDGKDDYFFRSGDLYFPSINSGGTTYGVMINSPRGGWNSPYGWADDDPGLNRGDGRYDLWRENGQALYTTDIDARTMPAHIAGMGWRGTNLNGVYLNINGKIYANNSTHIYTVNNNRTPANFTIGSEGHVPQSYGNELFQGGISEVFAYSIDHVNGTENELQRINSYLAIKYGITLKGPSGTGVPDYLSSNSVVVWDATANNGYNNNIAGIARDDNSTLHQKQSMSNSSGQQVLIGTTGLANTNVLNTSGLTEGQFLIWGDNGAAKSLAVGFHFASVPDLNLRFGAVWKVQNTNSVGTVRVAWPAGIPNLHLLQSDDETFDDTDTRTDMSSNLTTVNGIAYNYADVTLSDGKYFTFAGYIVGPGGVASAAWYRADAAGQQFSDNGLTTAEDGETIQKWLEYKGTGFDLIQASAGARPVYSTSKLANFHPTLTFTGNKWMRYTAPNGTNIIDREDGTIYTAGYWNSANNADIAGFGAGTEDFPGLHVMNKKLLYYPNGNFNGLSTNDIEANHYSILGGAWKNNEGVTASLNGIRTSYVSGNAAGQVSNVSTSTAYRDLQVGYANYGSIKGQINEVVVFENKLTESEMDRVETYMAIKYGSTYAAGTRDYVSSTGSIVWSSAENNGYHYNIAGIARDDQGALSQKQSWSTNPGAQVLISTTGLANTNSANTTVLSNGQFLIWGDNNLAKSPAVPISGISGVNYRFASIWKVQNTNSVGTVRVAWPKGYANLKLIQSSDDDITSSDMVTDMVSSQIVNGIEYAYADVVLSNGQYFTFAAFIQAPGGVTNHLSHWYRADKMVNAAGDDEEVNNWTDFTSGVTSSQLEDAALPVYKSGGPTYFNFNPGINFTNATQALGNISVQTLTSTEFDIFTFTKENMGGSGRFFNIGMNNTTFGGGNWDQPGLWANGRVSRRNSTGSGLITENPAPSLVSTHPNMMYYSFGNTSWNRGLNGGALGTTITHAAMGQMTGGHIFGANNGSASGGDDSGFTGHVGEVIIYGGGNITAAERNKVETYLAIKYGITLNNTNNYTTSQDVVIWDAATSTGYYNNVAGIGNDFISALHQKQSRSQHQNSNGQVIIGVGTISETNLTNPGELADGQFLVWGDNGNMQSLTQARTPFNFGGTNTSVRMNRIWKVQNTGVAQSVTIRFPKTSVGDYNLGTGECQALSLIVADNAAFDNAILVPLSVTDDEVDFDATYTFPDGVSYFTYAKVTPYSPGVVYLPEVQEVTNEYSTCGVGEWTHFHRSGQSDQKLIGFSGFTAAELNDLEVTITPSEEASYESDTRTSRLMSRITTVTDLGATYSGNNRVRIYYNADEMEAAAVPGESASGWYKYSGDADEVITDIYADGLLDPTKTVSLTPVASGVEDGVPYVEFGGITSFSSFVYLSTSEDSPLPVTLSGLKVSREGNTGIITWETTSETQNAGFEIERSNDARNWTTLGFVASKSEGNLRPALLRYIFTDEKPFNGRNYYRLKMVDLDGSYEHSHVVMLNFVNTASLVVYPNPVTGGVLKLDWSGTTSRQVKVYNLMGREVLRTTVGNTNELNVSGLPAGQYIIQMKLDNEELSRTFVIP